MLCGMELERDVPTRPQAGLTGLGRWLRTPWVAGLLLLVVYGSLSFANDPRGYLGTDTGAKVATLAVMHDHGTARPDLGYWAAPFDPTGRVHPIYQVAKIAHGWVQVTTLPMLELARPLYDLGGYRATLLLPMLGAIGAAFAARSLARRARRSEAAGWAAFWVVGLASPIVVYALDLWEHAIGVACVLGAVALLAGVLDGARPVVRRALAAGALLGLAATMRNEALVYAVTTVGAAQLFLVVQGRRWRDAVRTGVAAVAGFAVPWFANVALSHAVGGLSRSARATGAASSGLGGVDQRAREAVVTLLALRPADLPHVLVVGGALLALLAGVVLSARHGRDDRAVICGIGAGAVLLVTTVTALGFVPGLFAAAPIAVVALVTRPRTTAAAYPLVVALVTLPLVWAFQYVGGADPQWAGRYALPSCLLLVALGAAHLVGERRAVLVAMVALSLFVTTSGELWLRHRSQSVDQTFAALVQRPEDVLIARDGFFVREGGPAYLERRWLTAADDSSLDLAVQVVREAGLRTFAIIDEWPDAPRTFDGATLRGTDERSFLSTRLYLHSYALP